MNAGDPLKHIVNKYPTGYHGLEFARFMREHEAKENLVKEAWFNKMKDEVYGHILGTNIDKKRMEKEDEKKHELECKRILRDKIQLERFCYDWCHRRPAPCKFRRPPPPQIPCPGLYKTEICKGMLPVAPEMLQWLCTGTRRDGTGSKMYLKLRCYVPLEERYCLPPSVNQSYGWKLWESQSETGTRCPRNASAIAHTRSRVGALSVAEYPEPAASARLPPPPRPQFL